MPWRRAEYDGELKGSTMQPVILRQNGQVRLTMILLIPGTGPCRRGLVTPDNGS
jgi:hypothetical protein